MTWLCRPTNRSLLTDDITRRGRKSSGANLLKKGDGPAHIKDNRVGISKNNIIHVFAVPSNCTKDGNVSSQLLVLCFRRREVVYTIPNIVNEKVSIG